MNLTININLQDWKLFQQFHHSQLINRSRSKTIEFFVNLVLWAFIGFVFMAAFNQLSHFHWPSALSVFIFAATMYFLSTLKYKKLMKSYEPSDNGTLIGEHTFTINEKGISSKGKYYNCLHDWSAIKHIMQTNELVIIYIDTMNAFIFPKKEISDPNSFYNHLIELNTKYNKSLQSDP